MKGPREVKYRESMGVTLRDATDADRELIARALTGELAIGRAILAERRFKVHDGDLRIDGDWRNDETVAVFGSATVSGHYDDYPLPGIGSLIVIGDFAAHDVYNWGDLIVTGDVRVRGVLLAIYNDFVTRVGGRVHARGVIVDDKSCVAPRGEVGFFFTDYEENVDDIDTMFRTLVPECYTNPRAPFCGNGPDEGLPSSGVLPDHEYIRGLVAKGQSPFRVSAGPAGLAALVRESVSSSTSDERLRNLVTLDPLLAQLVATRPDLSKSLVDALVGLQDDTVDAHVARTHPSAIRKRPDVAMYESLALNLVEGVNTPDETLLVIARHPDRHVRRALIWRSFDRPALADDIVNALALTDDIESRCEVIDRYRSDLPDETIARLVDRDDPATARALACIGLTPEEVDACSKHWDDSARATFADALRNIVHDGERLRMTSLPDDLVDLAERVLTDASWPRAASALVALPLAEQQDVWYRKLRAGDRLAGQVVARFTLSPAVMSALLDACESSRKAPMSDLAENPRLAEPLQLRLVALAKRALENGQERGAADKALTALLRSQAITDTVRRAIVDIWQQRGGAAKLDFQSTLTRDDDLPPDAFALVRALDREGDAALATMLHRHATRSQAARAIASFHAHDKALLEELAALNVRDDAEWFARLGTAKTPELRRLAGRYHATPPSVLAALARDTDEAAAWAAKTHVKLPDAERIGALRTEPTGRLFAAIAVPRDVLDEVRWDMRTIAQKRAWRKRDAFLQLGGA